MLQYFLKEDELYCFTVFGVPLGSKSGPSKRKIKGKLYQFTHLSVLTGLGEYDIPYITQNATVIE